MESKLPIDSRREDFCGELRDGRCHPLADEVLVIVAVGGYQRLGLAGRTAELLLDFSPDLERRMVERRVEVAKLLVAQRPIGQSYAPVSQGVAAEPGIGESGVEFGKPEFCCVMQSHKAVKLKDPPSVRSP